MDSKIKKGIILAFITAIVSGFSIFINQFGVKSIDSSIFTFSKNALVAIFLISGIAIFSNSNNIKSLKGKHWIQLSMIGLVGGSIPFLLFFKGLQLSTGANAAFIHKMMFIFVAVGAVLFLKEKLNRTMLVGAFLLLIGNGLLLKFGWTSLGYGELMVFSATILWSAEQLISKHTLKELTGNIVAAGRMFFGSLFILSYLLFAGKISTISSLTSPQLGWILITSILLLAYQITWYNGLKFVNVSVAVPILLLGSVITTILQLAFSDTVITSGQTLGLFMILTGVALNIGYKNILPLLTTKKWTA
ncbi:MAG: DMT family transporter [Candidatus Woesearchaeota archaeon]|nr:MAG: DMT family transporter [Candidatus Woesearchaeota archaeon]